MCYAVRPRRGEEGGGRRKKEKERGDEKETGRDGRRVNCSRL